MFDPDAEKLSLKDQTHKKCAAPSADDDGFDVYLDMPLTMSLCELMSYSKLKRHISKLLGEALHDDKLK